MAGRGAPNGNKYAEKEVSERKRGITISYYLGYADMEFLGEGLEFETEDGSVEAIRKHMGDLIEKTVKNEIRRMMSVFIQSDEGKAIIAEAEGKG